MARAPRRHRGAGGRRAGARRRRAASFTLVEVLVAVTILAVGIVVVLGALQSATAALSAARDALYASLLLREKLAALDADLAGGQAPPRREEGAFGEPYAGFRWEAESEVADTLALRGGNTGRLYRVVLRVRREGTPNTSEAATYARD